LHQQLIQLPKLARKLLLIAPAEVVCRPKHLTARRRFGNQTKQLATGWSHVANTLYKQYVRFINETNTLARGSVRAAEVRQNGQKGPKTAMGSPANGKSIATVPPAKRKPAVSLPATARSAVTNGRLFAAAMRDGRSGWSRRVQDVQSLIISHLGGEDEVSEPERILARRIGIKTVELEWKELGFAQSRTGPSVEEFDSYLRGSNSLRRYLESIGLKRVARDVTPPTFEDIRRELDAEKAAREKQDDDVIQDGVT
jgi:hypothetical protein